MKTIASFTNANITITLLSNPYDGMEPYLVTRICTHTALGSTWHLTSLREASKEFQQQVRGLLALEMIGVDS